MKDQVVFITGPARGIGEAVARKLAARGAKLALAGMEPERLAELARSLGPQHIWMECDVTNDAALRAAVQQTVEKLGGIDVVIANAGIIAIGMVGRTPMEAHARVVDVNVTGVIRTVHATLPHVIARKGYYLLISSAAAFAPAAGLATYAGTKAAVEQFGNALRLELRAKGVRVGVAHPCWTDSDMVRDPQRDLPSFNKTLRKFPGPFGRVTSVDVTSSALADAAEKRRRKIYIPRSLGLFAPIRQLLMSSLFDLFTAVQTRDTLPELEREIESLGRSFGEHSVETSKAP